MPWCWYVSSLMNVAEFDKKWELVNQLAKQVSYQLQHKVPPSPEHQPLKLLFMTQKWIKQVLLSELVEVQRMVHGGAAEPRKRSFLRGARSWPKASCLCSPKPKPTQSQNSTKFDWKTNILVYQGCTLQYWPDPLCWPKSTEKLPKLLKVLLWFDWYNQMIKLVFLWGICPVHFLWSNIKISDDYHLPLNRCQAQRL